MLSMTGSNADERYTHKPSDTGAVALALQQHSVCGVSGSVSDKKLADGITKRSQRPESK